MMGLSLIKSKNIKSNLDIIKLLVDYDSNIELHPQLFSTFISQMDVMDNDTFTFNCKTLKIYVS